MLRRGHVQADHVGSLVLKIRIVARHVAFQAMGTDSGLRQNPLHRVLADAEVTRQLTARPMSGTVVRAILDRGQYRACSLGVRTDGFWPGCRSSISPAILCARNRSFQREIVGAVVSKISWIFR